jgi:hypothetical protein
MFKSIVLLLSILILASCATGPLYKDVWTKNYFTQYDFSRDNSYCQTRATTAKSAYLVSHRVPDNGSTGAALTNYAANLGSGKASRNAYSSCMYERQWRQESRCYRNCDVIKSN